MMAERRTNPLEYSKEMEVIDYDMMGKYLEHVRNYDYQKYIDFDVEQALMKERLSLEDYEVILSPAALPYFRRNGKKGCF